MELEGDDYGKVESEVLLYRLEEPFIYLNRGYNNNNWALQG